MKRMRGLAGRFRQSGDGFGSRVAKAGIWAFLMRTIIRGAQIVRVIILGRLLSPTDFGLMAIAVITLGMLEIFSQTGYRHALVQQEEDIEEDVDTAWSVEILRGLAVTVIVFLGAPLIANFFGQPDAVPILQVMSSVALINGFTNMAIVRWDRELRFDRVFRFQLTQRMTEVFVAIGVALIWPSVWALVIGAVAGSVARVTASFVLEPRRPHFHIIRDQVRKLTRFGKWIYITNALSYLTAELDDILVGRMLGTAPLGLYRMAFTISQSVVTEIAQTINQVMFPAFSLIQQSKERLIAALTTSTHLTAFIAFPMTAVFIVAAEPLTQALLGSKWLGMVPALQILAATGSVRTISSLATVMFEGAGSPHLSTRYAAIKLTVLVVTIVPLINRFGLEGAAIATLLAASSVLFPVTRRVRLYSPSQFGRYLQAIAWPLLNTVVMVVVMVLVSNAVQRQVAFAQLAAVIGAGIAGYAVSIAFTSRFLGYKEPREIAGKAKARFTSSEHDESSDEPG